MIFNRFKLEEQELQKACIFPTYQKLEDFIELLFSFQKKKMKFSKYLQTFFICSNVEDLYFNQNFDDFCRVT